MKDRHVITNTIRENYISASVSFENPPSQAERKQEIKHEHKKKKKSSDRREVQKRAMIFPCNTHNPSEAEDERKRTKKSKRTQLNREEKQNLRL